MKKLANTKAGRNLIIDIVIFFLTTWIFWLLWTKANLGQIYFYFLPERYLNIGYWHIAGLFVITRVLGEQVKKLSPFIKNKK